MRRKRYRAYTRVTSCSTDGAAAAETSRRPTSSTRCRNAAAAVVGSVRHCGARASPTPPAGFSGVSASSHSKVRHSV